MILKVEGRKAKLLVYKGKPIGITPDYLTETFKDRKPGKDVFQIQKDHNCQPKLSHWAKISLKIEELIQTFPW